MRNILFGLSLLVSTAEAKSFDEVACPFIYEGFTITVEYDPLSPKMEDTRRFYEEIMQRKSEFTYYKISDSSLSENKLPAVIVRCNDIIVYDSYGRTPPRLIWNIALDYFSNVLDRENEKCK